MEKGEDKYSIQFMGLAEGKHQFDFQIAKDFLGDFEETEINDLNLTVDVLMEKTSRHLSFEFHIEGFISVACDRCLEYFNLDLSFDNQLFVIFADETSDLTDIDDRMNLSRKEDKIDLAKHFYDYITLQVPMQKVHPDDENGYSTCKPEMLDKIEKYMGTESPAEKVDSRWDKLKDLYN